ncbi:MAG: N-acyl homoserine lactonase family protein [Longimicrobiales bacterium]
MKVHAVQTGTVRVHERQRTGRGRGVARFARTLLDRQWTEPLPIHVWVIEHPEGLIVVDTGETARASRPGYFPPWHPYYRLAVREDVQEHEEIGPRMRAMGLSPADVRWVVLTHLHTDHAGGLHHFPDAEILVSATEYAAARGLSGKLRGYLPHRWPEWFRPVQLDIEQTSARGSIDLHGMTLTEAGDVRIVPTPGHTAGHLSVLVDEGPHTLFLAGDASYTEKNLVEGRPDGVSSVGAGEATAARTLEAIREYAMATPTVYLPSHDPGAAQRLTQRAPVRVGAEQSRVKGDAA